MRYIDSNTVAKSGTELMRILTGSSRKRSCQTDEHSDYASV